MKKAKLVTVSFTTRVIAEEDATDQDIIEASVERIIAIARNETSENIVSIEDDTECPYGTMIGEKPEKIRLVTKDYVPTSEFGGGSLQGYFTTSYKKLVELFGEPNSEGDGYKVSSEWQLKSPKGKIVCLYDYKMTKMYDSDGLSVEKFRKQKSYDWHIGGNSIEDANDLIEYLTSKGL